MPRAFIPTTDVDGHFAGGVRLPHVASEVQRRMAGAPLGKHTPLNPLGLDPFHAFVFLGGMFTRFSDEDLLTGTAVPIFMTGHAARWSAAVSGARRPRASLV